MIRCYIALGSNLAEPKQQLIHAKQALDQLADSQLVAFSSVYRSAPMGPCDQPDYLNAVCALDTLLPPLTLLDALQTIEAIQGRERNLRWGARTLDLDLLLYGNERIELPRLTIPHYGMAERAFVLYPLVDIAPELVLPDGRSLVSLLEACPAEQLTLECQHL